MIKNSKFRVTVLLLVAHGVTMGMITKKIVNGTSRVQPHRRALCTRVDMSVSNNWMNSLDKKLIRDAYIDSIYKVAQIEAMCKIDGCSYLDSDQKKKFCSQVPYVVRY